MTATMTPHTANPMAASAFQIPPSRSSARGADVVFCPRAKRGHRCSSIAGRGGIEHARNGPRQTQDHAAERYPLAAGHRRGHHGKETTRRGKRSSPHSQPRHPAVSFSCPRDDRQQPRSHRKRPLALQETLDDEGIGHRHRHRAHRGDCRACPARRGERGGRGGGKMSTRAAHAPPREQGNRPAVHCGRADCRHQRQKGKAPDGQATPYRATRTRRARQRASTPRPRGGCPR